MVKILKYSYWILTVIILLMLALASILSPALLSSIAYTIIYLLYAVLTFVSAIFIPSFFTKILHVLLALLIFVVVSVKSNNDRYPLALGEGGHYLLKMENDTLNIELLDFTITHEDGSASAVHYESKILVDHRDTVAISVNHPFKYNKIRLYQSSYGNITPFNFYSGDSLRLFEGQYAEMNGIDLHFLEFDPVLQRAAISYNNILFYLPVGREISFLDTKIKISPDQSEMGTVLEYVEVDGHVFLLITAILYLLLLVIVRMRRK
jgi:ResB-like family protein